MPFRNPRIGNPLPKAHAQPTFDGAQRNAHLLGDLDVRVGAKVGTFERLPLPCGQIVKEVADLASIDVADLPVGRSAAPSVDGTIGDDPSKQFRMWPWLGSKVVAWRRRATNTSWTTSSAPSGR